jgi:MFS transporter, FHS family, glucose/mannose:H+ symporter
VEDVMVEPTSRSRTGQGKLMTAACAGMFVFGIVMAVLGAVLPSLFGTIGFNKAAAGDLFLVMNFAMLAMTLLFGPLVDRFGFRAFLIASSLLVAAAFMLLTLASTYGLIVIAAIILGFGGGGLNGGTNALTSDIHEPEKRGSALNVLGVFFGIGAVTIPFLIGSLLSFLGLPNILLVAVVLSLVPLLFFALLRFPGAKQPQGFPLRDAARIAKDPLLWLCGFLLFFQSGNEFTIGGWISTYLQESFGIQAAAAALILAGFWGALMAGRIVASRIVGALGNTRLVLLSAILALVAATVLRFTSSGAMAAAGVLLIGLGFAAIYPTVLAIVGNAFPRFSGTAFGIVLGVGLTGGMISPWVVGRMAQVSGLRQGLAIPVLNCAMIIVLQLFIMRVMKRRAGVRA